MGDYHCVVLVWQQGTCTGIGGMMTELQSCVCVHAFVLVFVYIHL